MPFTTESVAEAPMSESTPAPPQPQTDEEKAIHAAGGEPIAEKKVSAFKSLGWLDRFLAVWIFLAMVIGILIGNFVPHVTESLEKGKFVNVSVPIGRSPSPLLTYETSMADKISYRSAGHDVSHPLQCPLRDITPYSSRKDHMETDGLQHLRQLDHRAVPHARSGMGVPPRRAQSAHRSYPRRSGTLHRNGTYLERSCGRRLRILCHPRGCQLDAADGPFRAYGGILHQRYQW